MKCPPGVLFLIFFFSNMDFIFQFFADLKKINVRNLQAYKQLQKWLVKMGKSFKDKRFVTWASL